MRLSRFFFLFIFIVSFSINSFSQSFPSFFMDEYESTDSNTLNLRIDNTNFLKNNEYFNPFVEGYTLIGYWLKPQIEYNAGPKLSFYGGFHAQKYSGIDGFSEFKPLFSLKYKTGEYSNLVFGTLSGTTNHDIGDYLLAEEYYLTDNVENGIQFIHKSSRFMSDTWIDWKQFIFEGSLYPEILFFGSSNSLSLYQKENSSLEIKFSGVASHIGGQIDACDTTVQTIMNSQTGLDYKIITKSNVLNNIRLFGHYYTSLDQSPNKRLKYIYGCGVNSGIEMSNKWVNIRLEHWYGEFFFTKFGNQMFNSMNIESPRYTEDQRAFVNAHLLCKYEPTDYIKMGLGANLYFDLYNQTLEHSMGFYIKTRFKYKLLD